MPKSTYKPRPSGTLKDAVCDLVSHFATLKHAGEHIGVSGAQVQKYTDSDGDNAAVHMRLDQVRILEGKSCDPVVTRFLAHEAGYELVPIHSDAPNPNLQNCFANSTKEITEIMAAYAEAIADGEMTNCEAGVVIKEIDDGLQSLSTLRQELMKKRGVK